MQDAEFVRMLIEQVTEEVTREIRSHEAAADEVEKEMKSYISRIEMAMLDYRTAIRETLRERTLARVRRQPEPESRVENAALALAEAVESHVLRSVVDRLPEFRKTSPKEGSTSRETQRSIAQTAPVPAPVNVPVHAPVNVPVHAPVNVPVHAPVNVPVHAPVPAPVTALERTQAPQSTMLGSTESNPYSNLSAHSETHPLLLSGGTPEQKKLEWLRKEFDIHAEWNPPRKGQHVEHSIKQIRSGKFCAVAFFVGYSSHEHSRSVREACRESGTPFVVLHGAGTAQIKEVCKEIDGILLKKEQDGYESKN